MQKLFLGRGSLCETASFDSVNFRTEEARVGKAFSGSLELSIPLQHFGNSANDKFRLVFDCMLPFSLGLLNVNNNHSLKQFTRHTWAIIVL